MTVRFVDSSEVENLPEDFWEPVIISAADIDAEVQRLASGPMPANGRRESLIVHPSAVERGVGLAPGIEVRISVLLPGGIHHPKRHNATEVNFAIRGSGVVEVGGQRFDWNQYDVWNHPGWTSYSHHNPSDEISVRLTYSNAALLERPGEQLGVVARGDSADVDAAYQAANRAFVEWSSRPVFERIEVLRAVADRIEAHGDELASLDVADNGSPISEMRNDVAIAVAIVRYLAGAAVQVRGETFPTIAGRLSYSQIVPYGVVGRIIPFNHPFMFAATKIAAPLLTGNTIVVKPSEHTSLSALRLAELTADLLPPGVVNYVTGYGHEAGDAIVRHRGIRRLAFIGSAATGRAIQIAAAETGVKTVTLELGGKNPIVVLPSADLDAAASGVVRGMNFTWQGQSCGSTSRLIAHRDIYDELLEKVVEQVRALTVGLPSDPGTNVGAIVSAAQYEKVGRYLELGASEGAEAVVGGSALTKSPFDRGWFVEPTVFADVTPTMRLAREEIFGPVLATTSVEDESEALTEELLSYCETKAVNINFGEGRP